MAKILVAANGRPHHCCTCNRPLSARDSVVYLGWGIRDDGRPGPGWVAALCGPTPAQIQTGSPCVASARRWADDHGVRFSPSTLIEWLGR